MQAPKELWTKATGRQYDHYIQSFADGEPISPELAHKMATQWAERHFEGHECIVATHIDRGHTHSHIIVNSVNFENGQKLHTSAKWLKEAKEYSDELCRENGLSITQKGKTFEGKIREDMVCYTQNKYQLLEKAATGTVKSYVLETAVAVMRTKATATSKEEFVIGMAEKGYETNWQDNHKNITFTDPNGNKVRNSNIAKTFKVSLTKEDLEHEFERNRGRKGIDRTANRDYARANNQSDVRYTVPTNEPVGSGTNESREHTTQTDIGRLHEQLQQIRGIGERYNPSQQRNRDEQHQRAELIDRAERDEATRGFREENKRVKKQQRNIKQRNCERDGGLDL